MSVLQDPVMLGVLGAIALSVLSLLAPATESGSLHVSDHHPAVVHRIGRPASNAADRVQHAKLLGVVSGTGLVFVTAAAFVRNRRGFGVRFVRASVVEPRGPPAAVAFFP